MQKTSNYTTYIPDGNRTIAVSVNYLSKKVKNNKNSAWNSLCNWGKTFGQKQGISEEQILEAIKQRRYGAKL